MTVISDNLRDIGYDKPPDVNNIVFLSLDIRDTGAEVVVKSRHRVQLASDGSFTTDDLDPGPCRVSWGHNEYFDIEIPDSGSPIRLGPLLDAVLPEPPTAGSQFVRNAGHVARAISMSEADYATLIASSTPDPDTIFFLY